MKCPRCGKPGLRQQVSVYVDCDVDRRDLSKKGIRSRDVQILGVGWPLALWYCPECGWMTRLNNGRKK